MLGCRRRRWPSFKTEYGQPPYFPEIGIILLSYIAFQFSALQTPVLLVHFCETRFYIECTQQVINCVCDVNLVEIQPENIFQIMCVRNVTGLLILLLTCIHCTTYFIVLVVLPNSTPVYEDLLYLLQIMQYFIDRA